MRNLRKSLLALSCLLLCSAAAVDAADNAPKIASVNFKRVAEESNVGKEEQAKFVRLNEQIKAAIESKESELAEAARLWNDPDHRDSLSPEAEEELSKRGTRLRLEFEEMRKRSMEMVQQANYQVVQKLSQAVIASADAVAEKEGYDMIVNRETCFFLNDKFDITDLVIKQMNADHSKALAAQAAETATTETQ